MEFPKSAQINLATPLSYAAWWADSKNTLGFALGPNHFTLRPGEVPGDLGGHPRVRGMVPGTWDENFIMQMAHKEQLLFYKLFLVV